MCSEIIQVVVITYNDRYRRFYWDGTDFTYDVYKAKHYKRKPGKIYIEEQLKMVKEFYPDKDLYIDVVSIEVT